MLEWHAQGFVWQLLTPRRLTEDQMIALYCRYLAFEGGRGLAYGARHYCSTTPDRLTAEEVLELIAISRSPSRFSRGRNRDILSRHVERLKKLYEAP